MFCTAVKPYQSIKRITISYRVCVEDIEWPEEDEWAVRDDAKSLITLLLQHNPMNRLGAGGAQEVKGKVSWPILNLLL